MCQFQAKKLALFLELLYFAYQQNFRDLRQIQNFLYFVFLAKRRSITQNALLKRLFCLKQLFLFDLIFRLVIGWLIFRRTPEIKVSLFSLSHNIIAKLFKAQHQLNKDKVQLYRSMQRSKLQKIFVSYGQYHDNSVNKAIHIIFVPTITITLVSLLNMIPLHLHFHGYNLGIGIIMLAFVFIFYTTIHVGLTLLTGLVTLGLGYAWNAYFASWTYQQMFNVVLITHIVSWIFQFIGHGVFQGRKPALLDSLSQVFSAPMFVLIEVLMILGIANKEWYSWNKDIKERVKIHKINSRKTA